MVQQYLPSVSYQEIENLASLEILQEKVQNQILSAQDEGLRENLIDLYVLLATQFWLDNSCFETKFMVGHPGVVNAFVEKIDLIIQT